MGRSFFLFLIFYAVYNKLSLKGIVVLTGVYWILYGSIYVIMKEETGVIWIDVGNQLLLYYFALAGLVLQMG